MMMMIIMIVRYYCYKHDLFHYHWLFNTIALSYEYAYWRVRDDMILILMMMVVVEVVAMVVVIVGG
jgi:hypothetical protein